MIKIAKKTKIKISLSLVILISLFISIRLILNSFNQPVVSNVSYSLGSVNSNYYSIDLTPVKRAGSYASFSSPKGVSLVSTALTSVISVEDFTFYVKDVYSWTLAIDIIRTPSGQLDEDSSYIARIDNPSVYSQSYETVNGQLLTIMTDKTFSQGFSKVAFLSHRDYVATVSLIGNDTKGVGPLISTFNMVLGSWQWLK